MLGRFFSVIRRVQVVPVRDMRVVSTLFVVTRFMMFSRLAVMPYGVLVMLCRLEMVLRTLMLRHVRSSYVCRKLVLNPLLCHIL
jgi:hypothetical protein